MFSLSLAREVLQSWIPSRSSDCLDLVLNTLGTLLGAMIFVWGYARVRA
ncbi:MAG: VanZ family protein [Deltaproteobacteria bacterium]|nr:VanZ family protein [Deltaproteobacteria bacterium]